MGKVVGCEARFVTIHFRSIKLESFEVWSLIGLNRELNYYRKCI